ncbi:MAG: 50S ribosomal protein L4, partial [Bacteroidales bacterium]|nr:50S ribosomal protein L4 [Bacteroidales bacterium]
KLQNDGIKVVDDIQLASHKTKGMVEVMKNLQLSEKKSLIVLLESNNFVSLSSRNLPLIKVVNVSNLNTYDIMNAQNLLFVEASARKLDEMYGQEA